ncbi:asparaginase [Pelagibius sp. Alg239-R121]|uniref:asparaginase n=1 Tax=Pelagibius sp. Alg239-R121 TaxID=2993448 RepID=UPI0024A71892|nr:asparaginase [Pelagibius sp. Alg239-R121]
MTALSKLNSIAANGNQADGSIIDGKADADSPILVEVTRGSMVESRHRASLAVVDSEGGVVFSSGAFERVVYGRSAVKPLQAIPLVESGAAEAFNLSDAEISIACASHDGEDRHLETVRAWLPRIGCSVSDLECGAHLPYHEASMIALLRSGGEPTAAHNNCSGKHTGFLTLAKHLDVDTKGYIKYEHPVQQRILGVLESMCGLELGDAPRGIDGCGIPVIGIPLGNIALGMARMADPSGQSEARQAACKKILGAMAAEPVMVAGSTRFCTRIMESTSGRALVKTGAEGVYCGAIPELGLGFALKVDDGATRAAEVVTGQILRKLGILSDAQAKSFAELIEPPLFNRVGKTIGQVRAAEKMPF